MGLRKHKAFSNIVLFTIGILCLRLYIDRTFQDIIHIRSTHKPAATSTLLLISSADEKLLKCSLKTWLEPKEDHFIFSNHKLVSFGEQHVFQKFHLYSHWALIRSQSLYVSQFFSKENEPEWYIFASDNSIILLDELKGELSKLDSAHSYYAIIASSDKEETKLPNSLVPITILSRGALSMLMRQIRSQSTDCDIVEGSLRKCLKPAVDLNLQRDSENQDRFLIIKRHFGINEMNDYKRENEGNYTDSSQIFSSLSPKLISFHKARCEDMQLINIMIKKLRIGWNN